MAKGRTPIVQPAFEKLYGSAWKEKIQSEYEGLTKEEAGTKFREDTGIEVTDGAIYGFFNTKLEDFSFKSSSNGGKRGKKSTVLPLLLEHYKTEENIQKAFEKQKGGTIKEIAEAINAEAGTEISDANFYNLLKKYEISLSRERKSKTVDKDTPEGVDIEVRNTPVKFICQTPSCTGTRGNMLDLELGLGLNGRRCPVCNKFGTFHASYKDFDGRIRTFGILNSREVELQETETV